MADGDAETTPYEWFLYLCRRLVQWAAFGVGGCGTLLIFWFHWGNAYAEYGVKWYDELTAGCCTSPFPSGKPTKNIDNTKFTGTGDFPKRVCPDTNDGWKASGSTYGATIGLLGKPPAAKSYCERDTTTWCKVGCTQEDKADKAICQNSLPARWNGGFDCGPLSDNNKDWRKIFTFKPNDFLDMFTPVTLGAIELIQHLGPTYANAMISGTWIVRAIWLFALSLFAQFGYAGDLGVLCGYIVDFCVVLPCVALAILDHESDEAGNSVTTADVLPTLKWLLELCGLDGLCPGLATVKAAQITKDTAPTDEQASA